MKFRWLALFCLLSSPALSHEHGQTLVTNVRVEHFFQETAYEFSIQITGDIMLGTNECNAAGFQPAFTVEYKNNKIYVMPTKVGGNSNICTSNFEPVFGRTSIFVLGTLFDTNAVIMHNVDRIGRSATVFKPE